MSKSNTILNRVISFILLLALIVSMVGNILEYSYSTTAYSSLGTNKALGSPILNQNFSAEDWNRWEIITWGIFLSNFAIPFVDDYNSAFNLNSTEGSKGSGVKALKFGSGNDPSNTKALQELLDFAVNQQRQGALRPIYVSHSKLDDLKITEKSQFSTSVTTIELLGKDLVDTSTPSEENNGEDIQEGVTGESTGTDSLVREATVKDLFIQSTGTAWPDKSPGDDVTHIMTTSDNAFFDTELPFVNYANMKVAKSGAIPTFAIRTSANQYETILDYTDGYDLSLISGALVRAINADKDIQNSFFDIMNSMGDNPEQFKLYLDCFGNICTRLGDRLILLIPASANKYLTANPSINLVNSLVFNTNVSTASGEDLVLHAGQTAEGWWLWKSIKSGGELAVTNNSRGIPAGSSLIFYDTDTIVMQSYLKGELKTGTKNVGNSHVPASEVDTGKLYKTFYDLDLMGSQSQEYAFKIEQANLNKLDFDKIKDENQKKLIQTTLLATTQLINVFNTTSNIKTQTQIITDSQPVDLLGDPVVVPVQLSDGSKDGGNSKLGAMAPFRRFSNWVYQAYKKDWQTTAGLVSKQFVADALNKSKTVNELFKNLITKTDGDSELTTLAQAFILRRSDIYESATVDTLSKVKYDHNSHDIADLWGTHGVQAVLLGKALTNNSAFKLKKNVDTGWFGTNDEVNKTKEDITPFSRSIKVYPTSEVMRSVANVLGVRDGTDFAVFSTYIYLTYLDWYGVTSTVKTGNVNSSDASKNDSANFNTRIFDTTSDILNVDINSIVTTISEEEKEKQILDWTYTLLDPVDGRSYRSQMIISAFSDFVYDNYQKIVYGNASSYYDTGTGVTSRNSTGFLSLQPYSENFVTAWFISNYSFFASILIGIFTVLTIVMGLLRRRKFSWYLVSIVVMLNMILILPSTGEVAPLVANRFVQDMFADKMTYWGISEQVQNAKMEADYVSSNTISNGYLNRLSKQEQQQVVNLVKSLNVLYTDRSLMIRQDISKKVSGISNSTYEDVQQLRSARWMLPMIMREFTESPDNANYVYVSMSDKLEDLSNMYWYFNPFAADYAETVNSQQTGVPNFENDDTIPNNTYKTEAVRRDFYKYYDYHTEGYNNDESDTDSIPYKQKSYNTTGNNTHTYSYLLPFSSLGDNSEEIIEYNLDTDFDDYAKSIVRYARTCFESLDSFDTEVHNIESLMGEYDRFDRQTIKSYYGYLWATENPLHFFYQGIAECFDESLTYGSVIGQLYGEYTVPEGKETEVHKTFMHAGESGYLRDILDFEEMFKNMIPYLYAMQLGAEGYKDELGYFSEDDMIEGYPKHEFLNKSWIFRSNWVTKIMENTELNCAGNIRDKDGKDYVVANMLLPSCYPKGDAPDEGRPMIFSEAQMNQFGLDEADLSLVELKCIKVNKEVAKQWTLLVNYASVKGLTKEVMFRQMALSALFEFNKEFSPVGITGAAYQMYPTGLDLRSISFDSVMKMLMLNVTHDTAFIYGDTMQTIVEDADIGTALVLLVTAWICATFIPLVRNILMGAIFFLGLWAIIWAIMKDTKTKAKVSCGYFVSNVVFLVMTFGYYSAIKTLVSMTATDEVLTLSQIEINTGNPIWCLLVMLGLSCLYVFLMYKFGCMIFKSYRDMGFEIYAGISSIAVGNINKGIERLGSSISSSYGTSDHSYRSSKTQGRKKKEPVDVKNVDPDRDMNNNSGGSSKSGKSSKVKDEDKARLDTPDGGDYDKSGYTDGRYKDTDTTGSRDIDKQISKGREIDRKEREAEHKNNKTDQEKSKPKDN